MAQQTFALAAQKREDLRALVAQRDALAAALREFLAAVDGRYLVPSGALGSDTVKNPLAAVKATANRARAALAQVPQS